MSDLNKLASHLMRPREKRAASKDLTSFLSGRQADRESPEQLAAATEFFHSMKHAGIGLGLGGAGGVHGALQKQKQQDAAAGVKRNLIWGTTPVGQPSRLISGVTKTAGIGDTNANVSNKEMLNARLTNSLEDYEKQKERLLPTSYQGKQKTLANDHAGDNAHDHDLSSAHVVDQLKGIVAKTDDSIKEARIFGAGKPDGLDISAVPYASRKAQFKDYLSRKSNEEPTPMGTAVGTGLLAGGALGALTGAAAGPAGFAAGGVMGGGIGALVGMAMQAADKGEIDRAKSILAKGGIDNALANDIIQQRRSREYSQERKTDSRHRELIGAIEGKYKPSSPSRPTFKATFRPNRPAKYEYNSPYRSNRFKYAGAKGDEARARLKDLLAGYRDKIEDEQAKEACAIPFDKEAFISYGGGGLHLQPEGGPVGAQVGWKNYLGILPIPSLGIRVGDENSGASLNTGSIGIDSGHPSKSHAFYRPGILGTVAELPSKNWDLDGNPMDRKGETVKTEKKAPREKKATGKNYLASAGAGGALGAYKSLRSDSEERKQDRLLSDLGAMPAEVAKKRRNRRIAKSVGASAAGAATGAGLYAAGKHFGPRIRKTLVDGPVDRAATRFGVEGDKLIDRTKDSLDSSLDRAVDRLDIKTKNHVDRVSNDLGEARKNLNAWDFFKRPKKAPAAPGTSAAPKKKWFRSKADKYEDFADGKIDKLAAPMDYVGAGGGAVVGGIAAYRKAVKLRDTQSEWDSPDSAELGIKGKFVRAVNRDAAKHPGAAAFGGVLGGAVSGHAIQKGITAPFRRF